MAEIFAAKSNLNFDVLLRLNPRFRRFLDDVCGFRNEFPYVTAAAIGLFSPEVVSRHAGRALEDILTIFNTDQKFFTDGELRERYGLNDGNHIVNGSHLLGHVARYVADEFKRLAERTKPIDLSIERDAGITNLNADYTPQFTVSALSGEPGIEARVEVPLSKISGQLDVNKLNSALLWQILHDIDSGRFFRNPKLKEFLSYKGTPTVDLSDIKDRPMYLQDFLKAKSTGVVFDPQRQTFMFKYEIGLQTHAFTDRLFFAQRQEKFRVGSNLDYVSDSSLGHRIVYENIMEWSKEEERFDSRVQGLNAKDLPVTVGDIKTAVLIEARHQLEAELRKTDDVVSFKMSLSGASGTAYHAFLAGLHKALRDRRGGEAEINEAIKLGALSVPKEVLTSTSFFAAFEQVCAVSEAGNVMQGVIPRIRAERRRLFGAVTEPIYFFNPLYSYERDLDILGVKE